MFQPSLFISHGAPDIAVKSDHPSHRFLTEMPRLFARPDAIVILSAHWCTERITISNAESYKAIYDFGGFDERLYSMHYSPKGCPELARIIFDMLEKNNWQPKLAGNAELDHGAWIPLKLMYPEAYIPVVRISIQPDQPPENHYELGRVLAELRQQNILVIGSGAMTHNLFEMTFNQHDGGAPQWVTDFADWMKDKLETGDKAAILSYRDNAPYSRKNHPTDDHLVPLFIAMGAGNGDTARRIHTATSYGTVMMDSYAFGRELD